MKHILLVAVVSTLVAPLVSVGQTTVFNDTFNNGSTLDSATPSAPTANSTDYDIASTKGDITASTINPGDLTLKLNSATSSGYWQIEALFTSTPVTLATVGDYIDLTYTFTDTGGTILAQGASSYIFTGLYNSGGSAPTYAVNANGGLTATAGSANATGNAANWQGYVSRISNAGTSVIDTRPVQNGVGTSSANQDLVGNNLGGGSYNNPTGVQLGSETAAAVLTSGSQYTVSYVLAFTAAGTITITNSLYSGVGTGGSLIFSETNTASGANLLTTSFEGLAIGARHSGGSPSTNPTMDITDINVTSFIQPVPEPSTFALAGLGVFGFALKYRRSRR
jgi:hypothetical protein